MTEAYENIMCINLRKVTFSLGYPEFYPNQTPQEEAQMRELSKERNGYFHRWVEEVDTSKDLPFIKSVALVEDCENGKLYTVEYQNLKFIH